MLKKTVAILLVIIALIMIIMGARSGILPPILTGVGFIAIAIGFWNN
jgi:hypothetical protein